MTSRPRAEGAQRVGYAQSAPRSCRRNRAEAAELFCRSFWPNELPEDRPTWLANWKWSGRISMPSKPVPIQTTGTILDPARSESPVRVGRRSPQFSLGRTLAICLMGGGIKMRPLIRHGPIVSNPRSYRNHASDLQRAVVPTGVPDI